jgi:hypothetical protein
MGGLTTMQSIGIALITGTITFVVLYGIMTKGAF